MQQPLPPDSERYVEIFVESLQRHNLATDQSISIKLEKLFDTQFLTCCVTNYRYPNDIESLVHSIRETETTFASQSNR